MAELDNFDSAAARIWKQKVDSEIQDVESLLDKVRQITCSVPGSDDTIMKGIEAIGRNEEKLWEGVKHAFRETSDKTAEIISAFENWGEEALERVNNIIAKRS